MSDSGLGQRVGRPARGGGGGAKKLKQLAMTGSALGHFAVTDPDTEEYGEEEQGADNDCRCPSGKGGPLNVDEGKSPSQLIDGVLGLLCVLSVHALQALEFPKLFRVGVTGSGAQDDEKHFSSFFYWSRVERCKGGADDE